MSDKKQKKAPIKIASALRYDIEKDNAPSVVAIGRGYVAEKIIQKGHSSGVKVVEDKPLAKMLQSLKLGDEIPEELYHVVAQMLVFISDLDNEYSQRKR